MRPKAVFFDLGDTLVFQAHAPDRSVLFPTMARQVQPLLDAWNVSLAIELPTLLNEISLAVATAQPSRRERGLEVDGPFVGRGALAAYGIDISEEQAIALWLSSAVDLRLWGAQLYPDTIETLTTLHGLGLPVAIVSNSTQYSAALRTQLRPMQITEELAAVVVTSTDVMRVKPGREPFLRALELLGRDATDVVFVGDSLEADMRGAKALGMTTVWKLNGRHDVPDAPEADHKIHDLWELFGLGLLPEAQAAALEIESLTPHEDGNAGRY